MASDERYDIAANDHLGYMRLALDLAKKVMPKPTNFCVGAVLVDTGCNEVLSTGYTNELPGNTHAEQCAIMKFEQGTPPSDDESTLVLYTTMEPCNQRASGNQPCTETILAAAENTYLPPITTVFVGVQEPEKFVGANQGRKKLEDAGIEYVHVTGLEEEILHVATSGHQQEA